MLVFKLSNLLFQTSNLVEHYSKIGPCYGSIIIVFLCRVLSFFRNNEINFSSLFNEVD